MDVAECHSRVLLRGKTLEQVKLCDLSPKLWSDYMAKRLPGAEHADGTVSSDPTVGACWDADRLDLPRVGITPRPELFSTEAARNAGHRPAEPPTWAALFGRL